MTINITPSNSHGITKSWMDKNNIFKFRLNKLKLGDALICSKTGWSVMCMVVDASDALYVVYKDGIEMIKRKRPESLLQYLVNNVPDNNNLIYVEGGAINKMRYASDYTIDDFNQFESEVEVKTLPNNRKFVFIYLLTKDIFKKAQSIFEFLDVYRIFFPQSVKSFN